MKTLWIALVVVALVMSACRPIVSEAEMAARASQEDAGEAEAVQAANAHMLEIYEGGDAAAYAATYTEDAQGLYPNLPPIEGRAGIQAFWQEAMDAGVTSWTLEPTDLEVYGDTALEVGQGELLAGDEVIDSFKYVFVWKKRDGVWLLHRDTWNSNLPLPAHAADSAAEPATETALSDNVSVYATGFDNPRGLAFGPDGSLYVAEGGQGGTTSTTAEQCEQVPPPFGPQTGDMTARISKIDPDGNVTVVAENLPSSQTGPDTGNLVTGVSAVAFVGDTLYALIAAAGCSHGLIDTANGVYRVEADGALSLIADLSAYYLTNLTENMPAGDYVPDGEPFSMIEMGGDLYVVEANHGSLEKVTLDGVITRVLDVSATEGHAVPSAVAYHDSFFIGTLTTFPLFAGAAEILESTPDGELVKTTTGVTAVVGVVFDEQGRLYALELTTVDQQLPVPGTGKVVRMDLATGAIEEIATGLTFPTGMTMGPDGMLYVSNYGFGFPFGSGEVVQIRIP